MPTEEKDFWKNRDPVILFEKFLIKQRILDNDSIAQIRKTVEDKIEEAVQFGRQSPEPAPEDTYDDLYINMEVPR
jgi:pyruvate dehydrogenase E1 component alpha subunit